MYAVNLYLILKDNEIGTFNMKLNKKYCDKRCFKKFAATVVKNKKIRKMRRKLLN